MTSFNHTTQGMPELEYTKPATANQCYYLGRIMKRINAGVFEIFNGDPDESLKISNELRIGHKMRKEALNGEIKFTRNKQVPQTM